jgi:hypothetical protein
MVPDAALHLVSFGALPTGVSEYLVETGPLIHYLSAERDLVPGEVAPPGSGGLLALWWRSGIVLTAFHRRHLACNPRRRPQQPCTG